MIHKHIRIIEEKVEEAREMMKNRPLDEREHTILSSYIYGLLSAAKAIAHEVDGIELQ